VVRPGLPAPVSTHAYVFPDRLSAPSRGDDKVPPPLLIFTAVDGGSLHYIDGIRGGGTDSGCGENERGEIGQCDQLWRNRSPSTAALKRREGYGQSRLGPLWVGLST